MAIDMKPVESSNIRAVGYNPATRTMEVHFHGSTLKDGTRRPGGRYHVHDVSALDHETFLTADSLGRHYNAVFRRNPNYRIERLPDDE